MKYVLFLLLSLSAFGSEGRPDGIVSFKDAGCICNDGRAMSSGLCTEICEDKETSGRDTFFAQFNVKENSMIQNVSEWCRNVLIGDIALPHCTLKVKDEYGSEDYLPVQVIAEDSISVDVSNLAKDRRYIVELLEQVSQTSSDRVQTMKVSHEMPIASTSVDQFACLNNGKTKYYFNFTQSQTPEAVPVGADYVCHDSQTYGPVDSEAFPRLQLITNSFSAWNKMSPDFYDQDGNGRLDADDRIIKKVPHLSETTFFKIIKPLNWDMNPYVGNTQAPLGYMLPYFISSTNYQSYCLDVKNYDSQNELFKAIGETVVVGTEGLYVGRNSQSGDEIYIREAALKSAWFYVKDGVLAAPTENIINKTIFFYYPIDAERPYVKKEGQELYRLQTTYPRGMMPSGQYTSFPPEDRKIGCVPKY